METKVIIVGAGLSGIGAAKFLYDNGFHDFLVLEAQSKIGGRIETREFGNSTVELGAQWLHEKDNNLFRLIQNSQLLHETTSWEGEGEFVAPGGIIPESKCRPVLNWFDEQLEKIESYVETLPPYKEDEISKIPPSTGHYLSENFAKFMQAQAIDPKSNEIEEKDLKIALFQWANSFHRIDNSSNKMADVSLRLWAEFGKNFSDAEWVYYNFKESTQNSINEISNFLTPLNLKLNSPVTCINWQDKKIRVSTCQNIYTCDTIIVTCSIGVLQAEKSKLFNPPLPLEMSRAIDASGFGPVTKLYLEWDTPWWPKDCRGLQLLWPNEFIDCCVNKVDDPQLNWFKAITGFDPVLGQPNVLLGWVGGVEAIYVETLDEEIIKKKCAKILTRFMGFEVPVPKAALVSKWNSNPYVRGAYSYCSVRGDGIDGGGGPWDVLRRPIFHENSSEKFNPAIIFAGEGTHKTQYSTMHGAFASGEEQAKLFLKLYANKLANK